MFAAAVKSTSAVGPSSDAVQTCRAEGAPLPSGHRMSMPAHVSTDRSNHMGSFYSGRLFNLQLTGQGYQLPRHVHTEQRQPLDSFDVRLGELPDRVQQQPPPEEPRSSGDGHRRARQERSDDPAHADDPPSLVAQLPPAYHPDSTETGSAPAAAAATAGRSVRRTQRRAADLELPLSRTVSSGATLVASSTLPISFNASIRRPGRSHKVQWAYHPALVGPKFSRWFLGLFRYLRRQPEMLENSFPSNFQHALLESGFPEEDCNKVRELYVARIDHLNDYIIPDCLIITRVWMALMQVSSGAMA